MPYPPTTHTTRQPYPAATIRLVGAAQVDVAIARIATAPIDPSHPVEVIIRDEVKPRGKDANARMWAGPLRDIAEQAYVGGRTYSAEVWHEQFKREFLPEEYDPALTKDGYRKWDNMPSGARVLIGSTTQLTVKGFAEYLEQVIAYGASLGVLFSASDTGFDR